MNRMPSMKACAGKHGDPTTVQIKKLDGFFTAKQW
jgi:hypothetical protein